jgi:hypothetical protein
MLCKFCSKWLGEHKHPEAKTRASKRATPLKTSLVRTFPNLKIHEPSNGRPWISKRQSQISEWKFSYHVQNASCDKDRTGRQPWGETYFPIGKSFNFHWLLSLKANFIYTGLLLWSLPVTLSLETFAFGLAARSHPETLSPCQVEGCEDFYRK